MSESANRLRLNCGFQRAKASGKTNYPEEEHVRDCDLCQGADLIEEQQKIITSLRTSFDLAFDEWQNLGTALILKQKEAIAACTTETDTP